MFCFPELDPTRLHKHGQGRRHLQPQPCPSVTPDRNRQINDHLPKALPSFCSLFPPRWPSSCVVLCVPGLLCPPCSPPDISLVCRTVVLVGLPRPFSTSEFMTLTLLWLVPRRSTDGCDCCGPHTADGGREFLLFRLRACRFFHQIPTPMMMLKATMRTMTMAIHFECASHLCHAISTGRNYEVTEGETYQL